MKIVMERKLQIHRPLNRCKFSFLISIDLDEIKILIIVIWGKIWDCALQVREVYEPI